MYKQWLLIALMFSIVSTFFLSRSADAQEGQAHTIYLPHLRQGSIETATEPPFTIAVEYGIPGLAAAYAKSGVTSVKLRPEFGKWGNIEFVQGERDWRTLDLLVSEYQEAGFSQIQLLLMADSPWASISPTNDGLKAGKNTFPKAEFVDEYEAFVGAIVERYDHDGVDDMPGLLYPIHHYAVEAEFTGFWPGSAGEYVELLQIAYPAIHNANPEAVVALVAILAVDVFDGAPDAAEVERRFAKHFAGRKERDEIEQILDACTFYDVVDFHSLGDYTEIPVTIEWIRREMAERDCQKPVLVGDSFSMSMLVGYIFSTFHPTTLGQRLDTVTWLQAVAEPESADHAVAKSWLQAEMARSIVRKIVSAAGAGAVGINIGNFEDWNSGIPAIDKGLVPAIGASAFMGMIDRTKTGEYAGGPLPYTQAEFSRINQAGASRPALHALALVQEKVGDHSTVTKLDLGDSIWAYRFEEAGESVWVLWYDEGTLILPNQSEPKVEIMLTFPAEEALISATPTEVGQSLPTTQTLTAQVGKLPLTIGQTPLFVQVFEGN